MQITLMGTGTSHGVPVIACDCAVCRSSDPHDNRMRASAYVTHTENDGTVTAIVIDTGPEFRIQCLRYSVNKADAVLLTHSHADHLDGLDDVRIFSHTSSEGAFSRQGRETPGEGLPVYGNATTLSDVAKRFDYIFKPTQLGGGKPKLHMVDCAQYSQANPIYIGSVRVIPIPMMHGTVPTTGWLLSVMMPGDRCQGTGARGQVPGDRAAECRRSVYCCGGVSRRPIEAVYHSFVYLTDLNYISKKSIDTILDNCGVLDTLVIDGLRERHHSTHFTFCEALECADKIGAHNTYLTHICHNASHEAITAWCNAHVADYPHLNQIVQSGGVVAPAYDGQKIVI